MKNKNIVVLIASLLLSAQTVFATDITGVTGVNGVYNINPETAKGDLGVRHYENFDLSKNDVANLIMKMNGKDLSTFVNMVDNQININGIVNTMRDGNFANGHAVFISPNGMVVGASGVLNVGSLSVMAPDSNDYAKSLKNIQNVNLTNLQNSAGNAEIKIDGKVLTNDFINIQGKDVNINSQAQLLNGVNNNVLMTPANAQDILFNSIVKVGEAANSTKALDVVDGKVVIRTNVASGNVLVEGEVTNLNNGELRITSDKEDSNINIKGSVSNYNGGNVLLYGKNGSTNVEGEVYAKDGDIRILNNGDGINIKSVADLTVDNGDLRIVNTGTNGTYIRGSVNVNGKNALIQNKQGNLYIDGNLNFNATDAKQIINSSNQGYTILSGETNSTGGANLNVRNDANYGLTLSGKINSDDAVVINNRGGDVILDSEVVCNDDFGIYNTAGGLGIANNADVVVDGTVTVKNQGNKYTTINGNIKNSGSTVITSSGSQTSISGNIDSDGHTTVTNSNGSLNLTSDAVVTSKDHILIQNKGEDGMSTFATLKSDERVTLINRNGAMISSGDIDSDRVSISNYSNDKTALVLSSKIKGNTVVVYNQAQNGMELGGSINPNTSETDTATTLTMLNNKAGDMKVFSSVNTDNIRLINSGEGKMLVTSDAQLYGNGTVNLTNNAKNGMQMDGDIVNTGASTVLKNTNGDMFINGSLMSVDGSMSITNSGDGTSLQTSDYSYIVNGDGNITINNKCGEEMNLEGYILTDSGKISIINESGEAEISGTLSAEENPIIFSSQKNSNGMTISKDAVILADYVLIGDIQIEE